jgi:hypothetical protein
MKNKGCMILLIAGVVGLLFLQLKWRDLTIPRPADLDDDETFFQVVGFDRSGKPAVLVLEPAGIVGEYRRTHTESETRAYFSDHPGILWGSDNRRGGPYAFYIPIIRANEIADTITKGLEMSYMYVKLTVTEENPVAKTETVRLYYANDDYDGTSIYKVTPDGVTPILFGDRKKRDGAQAIAHGFHAFLVALVLLHLGFYVARRRASQDQKGR